MYRLKFGFFFKKTSIQFKNYKIKKSGKMYSREYRRNKFDGTKSPIEILRNGVGKCASQILKVADAVRIDT